MSVALAFVLAGLFADASALDRVAAVVGDKPIFLSEVRRRARPHLYRIDFMGGDAKERGGDDEAGDDRGREQGFIVSAASGLTESGRAVDWEA